MYRKNSKVNPLAKQLIEQNKVKSEYTQDFMKNIIVNILTKRNLINLLVLINMAVNQSLIILTIEKDIILG